MSTTTDAAAVEVIRAKRGFKPGHPRVGGRKPGSLNKRTRQALEICEQLGFHPAALLATIACTGKLPNPDGTWVEIDGAGRMDALKALCPYVMPRLQATQVSGNPAAPVTVEHTVDITDLLSNPDLIKEAQDLALKFVGHDPATFGVPGKEDPQ